jgi:hypothetical protein
MQPRRIKPKKSLYTVLSLSFRFYTPTPTPFPLHLPTSISHLIQPSTTNTPRTPRPRCHSPHHPGRTNIPPFIRRHEPTDLRLMETPRPSPPLANHRQRLLSRHSRRQRRIQTRWEGVRWEVVDGAGRRGVGGGGRVGGESERDARRGRDCVEMRFGLRFGKGCVYGWCRCGTGGVDYFVH